MPDPGHGGLVMILAKAFDVRGGEGQRGELARAARDAHEAQEVEADAGPVRGAMEFRIQVVERPIVLRGPRKFRSRVPALEIGHGPPGSGRGKKQPAEHEADRERRRASWLSHNRLTESLCPFFSAREGPAERCRKKSLSRVRTTRSTLTPRRIRTL